MAMTGAEQAAALATDYPDPDLLFLNPDKTYQAPLQGEHSFTQSLTLTLNLPQYHLTLPQWRGKTRLHVLHGVQALQLLHSVQQRWSPQHLRVEAHLLPQDSRLLWLLASQEEHTS